MKFRITRTSEWNYDVSPIKGAKQEPCLRVDERTFKSPEEYDAKLCKGGGRILPWLEEGLAHRKTRNGIARDFPATTWTIEIASLDALVKLSAEVGDIIVRPYSCWAKGLGEIEIYDGYRE